jgi:hypothetical protein
MQLYLKKILNYLFLLIFIFIIINLLISISWQIYSKLNKKPNAYNQKQLELLNLSNLDSEKLFRETWIDRHYVYDQFTEYKEKEKSGREFVNISNKDGRKIINNKNCKTNFAFYGSSITFGYNVTDQKTFSQLFKNILDDNYKFGCVYNYGRAGYGSTQENILFIKHIIEDKFNEGDFIFFLDAAAERGIKKGVNTDYLSYAQNLFNVPYHLKFIDSFKLFWNTLPFNQLLLRFKQKLNQKNKDLFLSDKNKTSLSDIVDVFEKNIKIRNNICDAFNLKCYTFIHPQSGVNGTYFKKFTQSTYPQTGTYDLEDKGIKKLINERKAKINKLLEVNSTIDLGIAFDNSEQITFIDRNHFSPYGHLLIAQFIFDMIKKDLLKY